MKAFRILCELLGVIGALAALAIRLTVQIFKLAFCIVFIGTIALVGLVVVCVACARSLSTDAT